ncbi:MAG TPA: hypothetical protein VHS58_13390 [Acetobacteraceae bacterium]|jgi:hypothetical protein|nr:hypothetical protein [Acetobacteraceae bacterium]
MAAGEEMTTVELESGECALVVGEDDGSVTVRVVAAADVPTDGTDLPVAPELVLALAKRLLKDPDFQDEVLDWYYEHQDKEADDDQDEEEED